MNKEIFARRKQGLKHQNLIRHDYVSLRKIPSSSIKALQILLSILYLSIKSFFDYQHSHKPVNDAFICFEHYSSLNSTIDLLSISY